MSYNGYILLYFFLHLNLFQFMLFTQLLCCNFFNSFISRKLQHVYFGTKKHLWHYFANC